MTYSHHKLIPSGLLRKLALGTAIAGSVLFGAKEASATPGNWNSFSEIVGSIPEGYYQNYTSTASTSVPDKICGILYYNHPVLGDTAIGGFDLQNGNVSLSYFGDVGQAYNANTGEGSDPNYTWKVFRDSNGDNILGKRDGSVLLDGSEQLLSNQYTITGFSPYGSQNPGTLTFTMNIPGPTNSVLTALSTSALGGGTNQVTFSVAVSNAVNFSINYKNSLTNAIWDSLGTYSKTGAVTVITDTNSVPQRFYRVVTP